MKKLEYFEVKIDVDLELNDIKEIRMSLKPSVEKSNSKQRSKKSVNLRRINIQKSISVLNTDFISVRRRKDH